MAWTILFAVIAFRQFRYPIPPEFEAPPSSFEHFIACLVLSLIAVSLIFLSPPTPTLPQLDVRRLPIHPAAQEQR